MELHKQVEVDLRLALPNPNVVNVDEGMARLLPIVNRLAPTYESCQNYGEYLRDMGLDFNHESKRDYAYIEFFELKDAIYFRREVADAAGPTDMLFHQIVMEGTPEAWELKFRPATEQWWVWFPTSDIPQIERVLK